MENTTSNASGKTQLLIIVSNVMGVESVGLHGFDWKVLPVTPEYLTRVLDYHDSMETENYNDMVKWKKEDMIIDVPIEEPGVLIWFIEIDNCAIDITDNNPEKLNVLMALAIDATRARPAHIRSDFEGFTNAVLADKILSGLKDMAPIMINKIGYSQLVTDTIL